MSVLEKNISSECHSASRSASPGECVMWTMRSRHTTASQRPGRRADLIAATALDERVCYNVGIVMPRPVPSSSAVLRHPPPCFTVLHLLHRPLSFPLSCAANILLHGPSLFFSANSVPHGPPSLTLTQRSSQLYTYTRNQRKYHFLVVYSLMQRLHP